MREDLYPCLGQSYRVVTTLKVGAAKLSHAQGSFLGRQVQVNHSITHKLQIVVRIVAAFGVKSTVAPCSLRKRRKEQHLFTKWKVSVDR